MFAFSQPSNIIPMPQKNNEWYTPACYIEAARKVMGGIDLDPASCEMANQTVKAERFYTKEDNGLDHPWIAKSVWLNPPYLRVDGGLGKFVRKLIAEYRDKHIEQAIMLTTAQVDSTWFQLLWDYPICFTSGRVHFYRPINGRLTKESRHGHTLGTLLVYLGSNEQKFIEVFSQFGRIVKAIDTPHQMVVPLSLWEDAQ